MDILYQVDELSSRQCVYSADEQTAVVCGAFLSTHAQTIQGPHDSTGDPRMYPEIANRFRISGVRELFSGQGG